MTNSSVTLSSLIGGEWSNFALGALLMVTSAARLRGWTGSGNTTVHMVGVGTVIVMIVFAVRYLILTPDSRVS